MKIIAVLASLLFSSLSFALTAKEVEDLRIITSPVVRGDTLYIRGPMGSHIYNYLAYGAQQMAQVKVIELSSFGGNLEWAMMSAHHIRRNYPHITTRIADGQFCASACVPLFAAGKAREMATTAGIGIHSARFGGSYAIEFDQTCMVRAQDGASVFDESRPGCKDMIGRWFDLAAKATDEMFSFYEAGGTSPTLRNHYFSLPLDPDWYRHYNVMKTPELVVGPEAATLYGLATDIVN